MKKMLIADDNKQITTILSGYAKKEGFEPVVALDGAEALDKYLQYEHEIAVVLLDVMMPPSAQGIHGAYYYDYGAW